MRRRAFGCTLKKKDTRVSMHTPANIQTESHKHTHLQVVYTDAHALMQHEYVSLNVEERARSRTRWWRTLQSAHTHQALPVTDVGRNIARKKALSFLLILSVFWHAYLCTQCGHVTEAASFLFQFLSEFSPPPPFFFLSYIIIMELKSCVPR